MSWVLLSDHSSGLDEDLALVGELVWKDQPERVIAPSLKPKELHGQIPEYYGIRESPWEFAWTIT